MNNQKKKAFTLVELLVVIAILAILATVSIIGYSSFIGRARKSNAQTEAAQAKEVIIAEVVSNDKGKASIDEDLYFAYSKGKLVAAVEDGHTVNEDRNITVEMKGDTENEIKGAFPELEGLEGEFWYYKDEGKVRYVKEYEIGENYKVNVLDTNDVIGPNVDETTPGGEQGENYTIEFSNKNSSYGSVNAQTGYSLKVSNVEKGTIINYTATSSGGGGPTTYTITLKTSDGKTTLAIIKATPNMRCSFNGWSINNGTPFTTTNSQTRSFTVNGDVTITANFDD